jgi:hypothetical protein
MGYSKAHLDDVKFEDKPCLRVSMGPTDNLPAGQYPRAYYFDADGIVLARSQSRDMISYENFQLWAAKQVPRHSTLKLGDEVVLGAQIDLIQPANTKEDEFFRIPNVEPRDWIRPAPW